MTTFAALLISLPSGNATLRMRVWRTLKSAGGGVLRDGVYVFPTEAPLDSTLADVEAEIKAAGGFAMTVELHLKTPEQMAHVRALFDRTKEYAALMASTSSAIASLKRRGKRKGSTLVQRLRRSFDDLVKIDYFPGQAQLQAKAAISNLGREAQLLFSDGEPRSARRSIRALDAEKYHNRTWVTRTDLWIDRIACVWLIKRFIDENAKFIWMDHPRKRPKGSVGFDFDGAQFSHIDNKVTFEVLLTSFGLDSDPGLVSLAQAIHYLDVGGIPVADAKGLEIILRGVKEKSRTDNRFSQEAVKVFDFVYAGYRKNEEA